MAGMPSLKVVVFPAPDIKVGFFPPDPLVGQLAVNVTNPPDIRVTLSQPYITSEVSGVPFFTFASASITSVSSSYALTASYAVSSSYTSIANYAQNAFPYTGSAHITGSLSITGSAHFRNYLVIGPTSLLGSSEKLLNIGTSASGSILFVSASGRVGVGTENPLYALHVVGDIYASGDVMSLSDARKKTNIYPIYGATDLVRRLQGVRYNKIEYNGPDPKVSIGFLAQDVQTVLPEVVRGNDILGYSVSYGNITALIVEAVKEIDQRLQKVEGK